MDDSDDLTDNDAGSGTENVTSDRANDDSNNGNVCDNVTDNCTYDDADRDADCDIDAEDICNGAKADAYGGSDSIADDGADDSIAHDVENSA